MRKLIDDNGDEILEGETVRLLHGECYQGYYEVDLYMIATEETAETIENADHVTREVARL